MPDGGAPAAPVFLRGVAEQVDRADDGTVDEQYARRDGQHRQRHQGQQRQQQEVVSLGHGVVHIDVRRGEDHRLVIQEHRGARGDHPAVLRRVGHVRADALRRVGQRGKVHVVHHRVKAAGQALLLRGVHQVDGGAAGQVKAEEVDRLQRVGVLDGLQLAAQDAEVLAFLDVAVAGQVCVKFRAAPVLGADALVLRRGAEHLQHTVAHGAHPRRVHRRRRRGGQLLRAGGVLRAVEVRQPQKQKEAGEQYDEHDDGYDQVNELLFQRKAAFQLCHRVQPPVRAALSVLYWK